MTFEDFNLNKSLLNALKDAGFTNPTPVQKETFSVILSGKDVVVTAQTGTGKTLAYLLPVLRNLKYSEQKNPRILILVPTRELVLQVIKELDKLTGYMNVRYAGIYGGTNINTQKKIVYAGLDIIVATPRRLYDIAMTGLLRLKDIKKLVIDEVDEMLNSGFRPQLINILEILPKKRQNLMFSATLTEDVNNFINDFFVSPVKAEIAPHGTPLEQIIQYAYFVPNYNTKVNLLNLLLEKKEFEKTLIFVSGKKAADRLYDKLIPEHKKKAGVLHSNKSQNFRIRTLKDFEEGTISFLIATDIIARGLDIREVSHVINFDMPEIPGDYIHRTGRTGRAGKTGKAVSLVTEKEQEYLKRAEDMMKMQIKIKDLPEGLKISNILTEEEKDYSYDKDYLKNLKLPEGQGAFHEKKEKNKKINSGSPAKKRKRNKKPARRSGKR
ncbi:MAG: DEAD/DEAH box helicase [Chlorobi bacterium]|nr:DEAD/DEAH box helicase [Chlorobiota bacterium]